MRRVDKKKFIFRKKNKNFIFSKIGESGRSTVELEKIIALMKKRIDNLQVENQTLKTDLDQHRATVNKKKSF